MYKSGRRDAAFLTQTWKSAEATFVDRPGESRASVRGPIAAVLSLSEFEARAKKADCTYPIPFRLAATVGRGSPTTRAREIDHLEVQFEGLPVSPRSRKFAVRTSSDTRTEPRPK